MNLIEAIKSGRPFRRHGADSWAQWSESAHTAISLESNGDGYSFLRKCDVVADDWEIQEPSVTITRAQFWEAVHSVLLFNQTQPHGWSDRMGELARKLGLGEP